MTSDEPMAFQDEESPSRVAVVVAARESMRPMQVPLDSVVRLAVTPEDLGWFPLSAESQAITEALDGPSTYSEVLGRAGLSQSEALPHIGMLVEMGIVALK